MKARGSNVPRFFYHKGFVILGGKVYIMKNKQYSREKIFFRLYLYLKIFSYSKFKLFDKDLFEGIKIILLVEYEHCFFIIY